MKAMKAIAIALLLIGCSAPKPSVQEVRERVGLSCDVITLVDAATVARYTSLPIERIEQVQDVCRAALAVDAALRAGMAGAPSVGVAGAAGAP